MKTWMNAKLKELNLNQTQFDYEEYLPSRGETLALDTWTNNSDRIVIWKWDRVFDRWYTCEYDKNTGQLLKGYKPIWSFGIQVCAHSIAV